jgi:putative aldouronate transport system permease protein
MFAGRRTAADRVFESFVYFALGVFAFVCFYPLWHVLMASLSNPNIPSPGILIIPKRTTLFNFKEVLRMKGIGHAAIVSVARTVIGTVLSGFAVTLMGYIFSKDDVPAKKLLYRYFIVTMYVGGGLIPTFLVYKALGLRNNFLVYVTPGIVSVFNMILVKTYVETSIPAALEESAVIDGAGYFRIFFNIILPLSMPIVATVSLFTAVGQWNSWFDNMIYTYKIDNLMTLQYLLYKKLNEASIIANAAKTGNASLVEQLKKTMTITPNAVRLTITAVVTVPIFLVYPFVQRFFIKGIMIGAIKG